MGMLLPEDGSSSTTYESAYHMVEIDCQLYRKKFSTKLFFCFSVEPFTCDHCIGLFMNLVPEFDSIFAKIIETVLENLSHNLA